jgi:hypothetical protein
MYNTVTVLYAQPVRLEPVLLDGTQQCVAVCKYDLLVCPLSRL